MTRLCDVRPLTNFSNVLRSCWAAPSGFIEPCLPSRADRPPSGPDWIHKIKQDGYRLMARRDATGIRLLTRHNWRSRYPLIVEAVDRLKVRSCLIDGEAVACDENGLAVFERLRLKLLASMSFSTPSTSSNWTAKTCARAAGDAQGDTREPPA